MFEFEFKVFGTYRDFSILFFVQLNTHFPKSSRLCLQKKLGPWVSLWKSISYIFWQTQVFQSYCDALSCRMIWVKRFSEPDFTRVGLTLVFKIFPIELDGPQFRWKTFSEFPEGVFLEIYDWNRFYTFLG